MPNPFSVTIDSEGDFAVIRLDGAVDAHTAPQHDDITLMIMKRVS